MEREKKTMKGKGSADWGGGAWVRVFRKEAKTERPNKKKGSIGNEIKKRLQ